MRDAQKKLQQQGIEVLGISPDMPTKQKKFDDKYDLGFPLLSDPDHVIAAAFGAWGEKKMYGKTYEGIIRSSFLIDADGAIAATWYKVSPKNTIVELDKFLASASG